MREANITNNHKQLVDKLLYTASMTDLSLTDDEAELLVKHLELVIEANNKLNLTSITSPEDAVVLHILDSLLLIKHIEVGAGKLLDIGSGGGYPGIPLAILSKRPTTLVDSISKKTDALITFVDKLKLSPQINVVNERIEEFALEEAWQYECVCARAVAPLPVLIEYASPLLLKGGRLISTKGKPVDQEIESGKKAADICGMKFLFDEKYELPNNYGTRHIFVYKKVSEPNISLPRRAGRAKKKPLA